MLNFPVARTGFCFNGHTIAVGLKAKIKRGHVSGHQSGRYGARLSRSGHYVAQHDLPAGERYAPLLSEYGWSRGRELELAHSRGDHSHHLPSGNPYRTR